MYDIGNNRSRFKLLILFQTGKGDCQTNRKNRKILIQRVIDAYLVQRLKDSLHKFSAGW
jgi:hypothetical protein